MHPGGLRPQGLGVADSRGKRLGDDAVHVRGGRAQPLGLGREVAADLVGVQVRLRVEVPHAGEGEPPAFGTAAEELLHERERGALAVENTVQPGQRPGHAGAARVGERAGHLQIRVRPRPQPPEDLQDVGVAVHDRGVGLLRADHMGGEELQLLQRVRHEPVVGRPATDERQQGGAAVRIVQPVVDQPVGGLADEEGLVPVGRVRPYHQGYLVMVGQPAVGIADLDDEVVQQVGQPHVADDTQAGPGPALAGEPALPRQPGGQEGDQIRIAAHHRRPPRAPPSGDHPRTCTPYPAVCLTGRYVPARQEPSSPARVSANQ